jgi:energy-coupling factor transporter ATP-binding protein EcfA2
MKREVDEIVRVSGLRYWYPGSEVPVLDGVDQILNRGEMAVLIGPSGCGKSTLMLALNGIVPKTIGGKVAGEVLVDGADPLDHELAEMATRVGLVFQDPDSQLATLLIRDEVAFGLQNLRYPREVIEERTRWALELVGLEDLLMRDVFSLSGGQKQRLAIASVLAMRPLVVVLDEPTANLDPAGADEVLSVVGNLRRRLGLTVIVVEHDITLLAAQADLLLVMDRGKIRFSGNPRDVLRAHGRTIRDELGLWIPQACEFALELEAAGRPIRPFPLTVDEVPISPVAKAVSEVGAQSDPPPASRPPGAELAVLANRVGFAYPDGTRALSEVSLEIHRGETVALLGRNGSGKSTLSSLLVGLRTPTAGALEVCGLSVTKSSARQLARHVGYVFQYPEHQFVAETVWDDLAYGPRRAGLDEAEVDKRVSDILEMFSLTGYERRHPLALSMGQKRRLSVAGTLITRPDVLILDEPTTGQDRKNALALIGLLDELRASLELTLLVITHDMRLVARFCERTIVLDRGRVAFDGSPSVLFARVAEPGADDLGLRVPDQWRLARKLRSSGAEVRELADPAELGRLFVGAYR